MRHRISNSTTNAGFPKTILNIFLPESKKSAREKAELVIAQLREMKLKEAAKKVQDGVEET